MKYALINHPFRYKSQKGILQKMISPMIQKFADSTRTVEIVPE